MRLARLGCTVQTHVKGTHTQPRRAKVHTGITALILIPPSPLLLSCVCTLTKLPSDSYPNLHLPFRKFHLLHTRYYRSRAQITRLPYLLLPLLPALTVFALPARQDVFVGRQDAFIILVAIGLNKPIEAQGVAKFGTLLHLPRLLSLFARFVMEKFELCIIAMQNFGWILTEHSCVAEFCQRGADWNPCCADAPYCNYCNSDAGGRTMCHTTPGCP